MWDCSGPAPAYEEYEILKTEPTVDANLRVGLPRWILQKVPLGSVAGLNGKRYAQLKTFGLPDTVLYRPGRHVLIEGHIVDYAQQTPFRTRFEWLSMAPRPVGYVPYPELMVFRYQLP
ncbi:hypothetical protein EI290_13395 [Hymenobacter metallilatus]|uniref:Uncharacterized protein n=2 Tax=Hymenobacter metallilatus TaxID=2493666 RepID=A0A428JHQ4_9BACT|nr:hypothetical protein EI290_13395 [Hymenobacter metallilatus]